MKKIIGLIAALLAMMGAALFGVQTLTSPAQGSATAYTKVTRPGSGGINQRIMVKCHLTGDWRTLYKGDNSNQVCGQQGWVSSIWAPDGGWLEVQNLNTGNVTQYGNCYKGSIGGGYYYAWVSDFPLNNHCP